MTFQISNAKVESVHFQDEGTQNSDIQRLKQLLFRKMNKSFLATTWHYTFHKIFGSFLFQELKMSLPRGTARRSRSKTLTKLEELVTCAVCLKFLRNPKVFPCLHSYCYDCIVELSKHNSDLKCPECSAPVEVRTLSTRTTTTTTIYLFWGMVACKNNRKD